MFYPHELEWIEGANIDQIHWILNGETLYSDPSISFIPSAYNPLYFTISAGLMKLFGIGFTGPRLLSILSTVGILLIVVLMVTTETKNIYAGIIAAGIYAVSFRFSGAWMDLAKTDSLFLFLILAGFFVGLRYSNLTGFVASGLLLVLAYYTKQVALPIILVLATFSLISNAGKTWPQWLTVGLIGIVIFIAIDAITDNWFSFYTLDNHMRHTRVWNPLLFWEPMIKKMWPAMLISLLYPVYVISRTNIAALKRNERFWGHIGLGIGLILASWVVFSKVWTYDNGFMPATLGIAILTGLGLGETIKRKNESPNLINSGVFRAGVLFVCAVQFAILA
ncbi:MAG: hypothetical protein GTO18_17230, partial [Anaerolineales bacterium]|nr:hypothetical protein [Anaerolineales bacterium]